jgi:hypothetical protein
MNPEVDTEPKGHTGDPGELADRTVALPSGARLCLFGAKVVLFDAGRVEGRWLSPNALVRLERGVVWHRLELGEQVHVLRTSVLDECLEVLALGKLEAGSVKRHVPLRGHADAVLTAALGNVLEVDELLLVVARTRLRLPLSSPVLGDVEVRAFLVISDCRCLLVGVSAAGDIVVRELERPRVEGRELVAQGLRLPLPDAAAPFASCLSLPPLERALETARICFAERDSNRAITDLLDELARRGDERAQWVHWFRHQELDSLMPLPDSLRAKSAVDPGALFRQFAFPEPLLDEVFANLPRGEYVDALVVDWATREWHLARAQNQDAGQRLASDATFAQRLLARGRRERARQVADDCLSSLPPPAVPDAVLPGSTPSDTTRARVKLHHVRLSSSDGVAEQFEQRVRLLRLEPLEAAHLRAIADGSGPLARRASAVLDFLVARVPRDSTTTHRRVRPVPADVLERRLRREVGIEDPALSERVKTWIAKEPRPDAGALRHYCERITRRDSPILGIVDEAATLLGLGHVEIYVSRGDDDVGVRAFGSERPFVLIGGQHLDEGTSYAMTPDELRFAIAAELLHVRVGNVRVGHRDVLRGALHKGRTGLDVALGVLPLLKGLAFVDRLGVATAKVSLPKVGQALEMGRQVVDGAHAGEPHGLSPAAEKLLSAQRALQLWADRVGLLGCGSFGSALRAMAITRHDTVRAARDFENSGVLRVLEDQRNSDPVAFDYLRLRVANLVTFFVSDEYSALTSGDSEG